MARSIYGSVGMANAQRSRYALTIDVRMLFVAILTFVTYAIYHMQRIGFSGIKSSMKGTSSFTNTRLGVMDACYLFAYAVGQFVCGRFADAFQPKRMLLFGMFMCSLLPALEGLMGTYHVGGASWAGYASWVSIHTAEGLFQATGWTATVAIMGAWFPISGRGTVFGIWSTSTSWGDILGLQWTAFILEKFGEDRWHIVLYTLALLMLCMALVNLVFLRDAPMPLSLEWQREEGKGQGAEGAASATPVVPGRSATVCEVLRVPGLLKYSFSYAFLKLVNYALFFWLPFYLSEGAGLPKGVANRMASLFDWGFIVGGLVAGCLSDLTSQWAGAPTRSPVVSGFLLAAGFPLASLRFSTDETVMCVAIFFCGVFQGGPAEAMTSSVSVDLGTHPCLKGARATSMVTGFIDGTGAFGAAVGAYFVSYLGQRFGWKSVFTFLLCSLACTFLLSLARLRNEMRDLSRSRSDVGNVREVEADAEGRSCSSLSPMRSSATYF